MPNVILSKEARNDLHAIRDYIQDELSNPDTAKDTLRALKKAVLSLQDMPERGIALDKHLTVHTGFRFLICKNYKVFYLFDGNTVEIVRVLHALQDYMQALFSS